MARRACTDLESTGIVSFHSLVVGHLSEACRFADRLEEAHAAAVRVLSLARDVVSAAARPMPCGSWATSPRTVSGST